MLPYSSGSHGWGDRATGRAVSLLICLSYYVTSSNLRRQPIKMRLSSSTLSNPLPLHSQRNPQPHHGRNLRHKATSPPRRPHGHLRPPRSRRPGHHVRAARWPILPPRRRHPPSRFLAPIRQIRDAPQRNPHQRRRARFQNQTRKGHDELLPPRTTPSARLAQ